MAAASLNIALANQHYNELGTTEPLNSTAPPPTTQRPKNLLHGMAILLNKPTLSNELASAHFVHCYRALRRFVTDGKMTEQEFDQDALEDKTNTLLDKVERSREEWERSRELIESAKQMRIAADGYIATLEEANKALAEYVNGVQAEIERLHKVNKEIARAAEVMAQISRNLE